MAIVVTAARVCVHVITRVCTRNNEPANVEQWGAFLELNAGVVQY